MTILPEITRVLNVRNQKAKRLSQALGHFLTAVSTLFTDHRTTSLPMRVK